MRFNPQAEIGATDGRQTEYDSPRRAPLAESSLRVSGSERMPKRGEYWCKPKLEKLKQMSHDELRHLHGFCAGRRGYGEVEFLEDVDLTTVDSLQDMLGTIIVFSDLELAVYPNETGKPPRGSGLNVPARISLENCFSKDKATKQPVTDPNDARYARHIKRVKNIPETEFISFTDDGTWTFKVNHFSRYGLVGSDDEDDDDEAEAEEQRRNVKEREAFRRSSRSTTASASEDDEDMLPPTKSLYDKPSLEDHDSGIEADDYDRDHSEDSRSEGSRSHSRSRAGSEETDSTEHSDDSHLRSKDAGRQWEPLKSKLGPEGMRKLREMQSSFFGAKVKEVRVDKRLEALGQTKRMLGETVDVEKSFFGDAEEGEKQLDVRATKVCFCGFASSASVRLACSLVSGNEATLRSNKGSRAVRGNGPGMVADTIIARLLRRTSTPGTCTTRAEAAEKVRQSPIRAERGQGSRGRTGRCGSSDG